MPDTTTRPELLGEHSPDETLPHLFYAVAERWPDRPALVSAPSGETLSFAQLAAAVRSTTAALARLGITAADKVALISPNEPAVVVATLAVLDSGAAWLPINSRESATTSQDC